MALGLYISVPFCRSKCSYCNFASDVFSSSVFGRYVDRVCTDIVRSRESGRECGVDFDASVDSVYFGGGTPTVLDASQLERLFVAIRSTFDLRTDAEITVECAPGTMSGATFDLFARCGVNRVSLGVQSFVDQEARSVGRLHNRATVLADIVRLRSEGIANISLDLIAGLPHQSSESWEESLEQVLASGATHASVYMLEVDQESRLGRELIAGGARYHASFVPDDDATADFYEIACHRLNRAGLRQYEISNFARPGRESRHNQKYWTRQPYLGFGVDAHSMLPSSEPGIDGVRFRNPDSLESYLAGDRPEPTAISSRAALEEELFLGLRLLRGVNLEDLNRRFAASAEILPSIVGQLIGEGLLEQEGAVIRLNERGRLLSNEVFERFLSLPETAGVAEPGSG